MILPFQQMIHILTLSSGVKPGSDWGVIAGCLATTAIRSGDTQNPAHVAGFYVLID